MDVVDKTELLLMEAELTDPSRIVMNPRQFFISFCGSRNIGSWFSCLKRNECYWLRRPTAQRRFAEQCVALFGPQKFFLLIISELYQLCCFSNDFGGHNCLIHLSKYGLMQLCYFNVIEPHVGTDNVPVTGVWMLANLGMMYADQNVNRDAMTPLVRIVKKHFYQFKLSAAGMHLDVPVRTIFRKGIEGRLSYARILDRLARDGQTALAFDFAYNFAHRLKPMEYFGGLVQIMSFYFRRSCIHLYKCSSQV